jgi:hypothetical protein
MSPRLSATAFSLAYCAAYAAVFALDAPLFLYYPVEGRLAWSWAPVDAVGPAMAWYGLMASAAAVALPVALVVPERRAIAALRNLLWLFPLAALLVSAWLLRVFFQGG